MSLTHFAFFAFFHDIPDTIFSIPSQFSPPSNPLTPLYPFFFCKKERKNVCFRHFFGFFSPMTNFHLAKNAKKSPRFTFIKNCVVQMMMRLSFNSSLHPAEIRLILNLFSTFSKEKKGENQV